MGRLNFRWYFNTRFTIHTREKNTGSLTITDSVEFERNENKSLYASGTNKTSTIHTVVQNCLLRARRFVDSKRTLNKNTFSVLPNDRSYFWRVSPIFRRRILSGRHQNRGERSLSPGMILRGRHYLIVIEKVENLFFFLCITCLH